MTFGDSKDFAIEAYHEPSGPQWGGFGRMAIDIQGVRIGDIRVYDDDGHFTVLPLLTMPGLQSTLTDASAKAK